MSAHARHTRWVRGGTARAVKTVHRRVPPQLALRVIAVDDETPIQEWYESQKEPGINVVAVHPNVETMLGANFVEADVVVLDLWIRVAAEGNEPLRGIRAIKAIEAKMPETPILVWTAEARRLVLAGLIAAGAQGVVNKTHRSEELFDAIRAIGAGEVVLTTAMTGMAQLSQRRGLLRLSESMVKVLNLLAKGMKHEAIAQELGLSVNTVGTYSVRIRDAFADLLRRTGQIDGMRPDDHHAHAAIAKALGLGPGDLLDSSEPRTG